MPPRPSLKGTCGYCGAEVPKQNVVKHLESCRKRQAAMGAVEQSDAKTENLFHLRVEDAENDEFWLDLEMRGSATLKKLDLYLRAIWLECCDHLSQFSKMGWGSEQIPKGRTAEEFFQRGAKLMHIYDFGTSSETLIRCVRVRQGKPEAPHPIALLARNVLPAADCQKCAKPAQWVCAECLIEEGEWTTFCDKHIESHAHDNYGGPLPLVNSPRLGKCGYDGPAEPPY
jgi:hypothetical protein